MAEQKMKKQNNLKSILTLFVAPAISVLILLFADIDTEAGSETAMLAVAVLMAFWWILDVVPLAVTSLLPVALFPLLGIMGGKTVSTAYFNDTIFLFIGGFIVALAMQKWNLHRRIALTILSIIGTKPLQILVGFMVTTAFLSMWVSNTATAMLMIPILISVISRLEEIYDKKFIAGFTIALLLGVAYSASTGGMATLVGTPPNLSFSRIYEIYFPNAPEISFAKWFLFAFPVSAVILVISIAYLYLRYKPGKGLVNSISSSHFKDEIKKMGKASFEQKSVFVIFVLMAVLWITESDLQLFSIQISGWASLFENPKFLTDGTVAIGMSILLYVIPSKQEKKSGLMNWEAAKKLPWNIVLLFGGGFALAAGFKESGLALLIGNGLSHFASWNSFVLVLAICFMLTFLTEVTSNTATAEMILPIMAAMSTAIGVNPLLLMIPAAMSCSMAFMLPVATPPNAIIFGTNRVSILQMAKTGIWLNLTAMIIITLAVHYWGGVVFGI